MRGVVISMSASCPEMYSLTNVDIAPDELRGRGTTPPVTWRDMFGRVRVKGRDLTAATGTPGSPASGEGREMTKGREGHSKSKSKGIGLMAVAFAEREMVPSSVVISNAWRVTRSENSGKGLSPPGRGSPGSGGTKYKVRRLTIYNIVRRTFHVDDGTDVRMLEGEVTPPSLVLDPTTSYHGMANRSEYAHESGGPTVLQKVE